MSESIVSIRVSDEARQLFENLSKSSDVKNKGDFFEHILTQYALEKTKDNISLLEPAVSTIQELVRRISEVIVGMGSGILTMEEKYINDLQKQQASSDTTIKSLQNKILLLEKELSETKEKIELFLSERKELDKTIIELQEQVKQQSESLNDKTIIIDEYKNKYTELNRLLAKYEKAYNENESLHSNIEKLTKEVRLVRVREESLQRELLQLEKSQDILKNNFENELGETLKKQALENELNLEKVILKLKNENQERLITLQDKFLIASADYENKVRELLEKLEQKNEQIFNLEKKIKINPVKEK